MTVINFQELFQKSNPRKLEWDKNGNLATRASHRRLPKINVYIDESGDRNFAENRQSDYFSMTAICVPAELDRDMRFLVGGLKHALNIKKPMHWVEHFRDRPQEAWKRRYLAEKLSKFPSIQAIHVVIDKPNTFDDAYMRSDNRMAYKYASKLLLERIAHAAKVWPGGERVALTRFGVVGGVDHQETRSYLENSALNPDYIDTPWENILWPVSWRQQKDYDGLQLADAYCGIFDAAIRNGDAEHLYCIARQVYRSWRGGVGGYGIKFLPTKSAQIMFQQPWWSTFLKHKDA